ncbi:hypothetical protein HK100_006350 [Physocladia obscura]|uniref:BTB domain-containing protein n=1 Tax=Physocladia obscura TaxID=109957 RepID=A0AAD5T636_9FUNG|nr:hypothetical protein HK100_006350 [Physocladia obscura]
MKPRKSNVFMNKFSRAILRKDRNNFSANNNSSADSSDSPASALQNDTKINHLKKSRSFPWWLKKIKAMREKAFKSESPSSFSNDLVLLSRPKNSPSTEICDAIDSSNCNDAIPKHDQTIIAPTASLSQRVLIKSPFLNSRFNENAESKIAASPVLARSVEEIKAAQRRKSVAAKRLSVYERQNTFSSHRGHPGITPKKGIEKSNDDSSLTSSTYSTSSDSEDSSFDNVVLALTTWDREKKAKIPVNPGPISSKTAPISSIKNIVYTNNIRVAPKRISFAPQNPSIPEEEEFPVVTKPPIKTFSEPFSGSSRSSSRSSSGVPRMTVSGSNSSSGGTQTTANSGKKGSDKRVTILLPLSPSNCSSLPKPHLRHSPHQMKRSSLTAVEVHQRMQQQQKQIKVVDATYLLNMQLMYQYQSQVVLAQQQQILQQQQQQQQAFGRNSKTLLQFSKEEVSTRTIKAATSSAEAVLQRSRRQELLQKRGETVKMFASNSNRDQALLLDRIQKNSAFADAVLLIGPSETPMFVHAAILTEACEFYSCALAREWQAKLRLTESEKRLNKAVVRHPDVDCDTAKIVLHYIYTGSVQVPPSLLMKVALFADHLLLLELSKDCVRYLLKGGGLTVNNGLEVYVACDRLSLSANIGKTQTLNIIKKDFNTALESGRETLCAMEPSRLAALLAFTPYSALDRWRVLVAWAKARQGVGELSLESGLPSSPDTSCCFDIEVGKEDIEPLIPNIGFFSLSLFEYETHLIPYLPIIPCHIHAHLAFHFKAQHSFENVVPWGKLYCESKILDPMQLEVLHNEVNDSVSVFSGNSSGNGSSGNCLVETSLRMLFRASEHNFSGQAFHDACDGRENTLTLIKSCTGVTFGGFIDSAWTSHSGYVAARADAFLFHIAFSTVATMPHNCGVIFEKGLCMDMAKAVYGNIDRGPVFGNGHDLKLEGRLCFSFMGSSFSFGAGKGIPGFERGHGYSSCEIEEYEVFELFV